MNIKVRFVDTRKVVILEFCSISDITNYSIPILEKNKVRYNFSIDISKGGWYGVKNVDEIIQKLKYGETKNLNELKRKVRFTERFCSEGKRRGIEKIKSVAGSVPIIPAYILGLPKTMLRLKRAARPQKIINLYIDNTINSNYTASDLKIFLEKVLEKVVRLEMNGTKIRITIISCFANQVDFDKDIPIIKTLVKNESEPLAVWKLNYVLTNPSFFRMVELNAIYDSFKNIKEFGEYKVFGRGQALSKWKDKNRAELLAQIKSKEEKMIYINHLSDIDDAFKDF